MSESPDYAGMGAPAMGRSLAGMGVNLLVRDIAVATAFQTEVLGVTLLRADKDFALLRHGPSLWMLHADHSYHSNPLSGLLGDGAVRGLGCELRLYGLDPDLCEARARAAGYTVLQGTADKPHGLRECYLLDKDNYLWVPGRASQPAAD